MNSPWSLWVYWLMSVINDPCPSGVVYSPWSLWVYWVVSVINDPYPSGVVYSPWNLWVYWVVSVINDPYPSGVVYSPWSPLPIRSCIFSLESLSILDFECNKWALPIRSCLFSLESRCNSADSAPAWTQEGSSRRMVRVAHRRNRVPGHTLNNLSISLTVMMCSIWKQQDQW